MDLPETYFLNNPVFLKYKRVFDWRRFRKVSRLKKVMINERIIEIPYAIQAVSDLAKGSTILDLGCMESMLSLFMASLGFQVTGLDFREYPYRVPNFKFQQGDILKLPFSDHSFDAALCVSMIEHVGLGFYHDPQSEMEADEKGVLEIHRILKPKGRFVLTVPFGQPYVNDQQRTYDKPRLDRLLRKFKVEDMRFFKNVLPSGQENNCWQETALDDAQKVKTPRGTDCVCCVRAIKIA